MAYVGNDTGGTADDRRAEADRLLKMLGDVMQRCPIEMTRGELNFVEQMDSNCAVSPKQLFWLRDIKDKYL